MENRQHQTYIMRREHSENERYSQSTHKHIYFMKWNCRLATHTFRRQTKAMLNLYIKTYTYIRRRRIYIVGIFFDTFVIFFVIFSELFFCLILYVGSMALVLSHSNSGHIFFCKIENPYIYMLFLLLRQKERLALLTTRNPTVCIRV